MQCSRCGRPRESAGDPGEAWDCAYCGTTNRPAVAAATNHPPPHPSGVSIEASPGHIVAVYRWFTPTRFTHALVVFALGAVPFVFPSSTLARLVGFAVIVVASYVAAMTWANQTTIRATRDALTARHGPVAIVGANVMDAFWFWPDVGDVSVPASHLVTVAKGSRMQVFGRKEYLRAVVRDRDARVAEVRLLPSMASPEVADFVAWYLDGWLRRAELASYQPGD